MNDHRTSNSHLKHCKMVLILFPCSVEEEILGLNKQDKWKSRGRKRGE